MLPVGADRVPPRGLRLSACKPYVIDALLLAAVWAVMIAVIQPTGNFPLDDDWSYGLTVRRLIDTGVYRPVDWALMTLFTHALWGALFVRVFGFSFGVLRSSTLVAGLVGMIATYCLLVELRRSRRLALAGALALTLNPVYVAISTRFMTDVLFIALMVLAALCLVRSWKTNAVAPVVTGTVLLIAAALCRQIALAVPLAFAVASFAQRGALRRERIWRIAVPLACPVMCIAAFEWWMRARGVLPASYIGVARLLRGIGTGPSPADLARSVVNATLYLGWFALPALSLAVRRRRRGVIPVAAGVVFLACAAVPLVRGEHWTMPRRDDVLTPAGIGPLTLADVIPLRSTQLPEPAAFWFVVTVIAAIGGYLLVSGAVGAALDAAASAARRERDAMTPARVFLALTIVLLLLPIFYVMGFDDRYVVAAVPFVIAWVALDVEPARASAIRTSIAAAALVSLSVVAVCGTRDYFAWNRARWQALGDLTARHVAPADIDGGFEFNGLYRSEASASSDDRYAFERKPDARFVVAFRPISGLHVVKTYTYSHWAPPYTGTIVVLERERTAQ